MNMDNILHSYSAASLSQDNGHDLFPLFWSALAGNGSHKTDFTRLDLPRHIMSDIHANLLSSGSISALFFDNKSSYINIPLRDSECDDNSHYFDI